MREDVEEMSVPHKIEMMNTQQHQMNLKNMLLASQ